ncbi:hypothetical protein HHK36_020148 [Tetracentron sinense]|uniref:Aminoacyl-tRNA synthetase class II (D/K/N) domain-containing protein n=1 Tax=Tetracentron sinense TaxID=13715 RepID=A0A835D8K4_TETSI|nr:hypothetical protein HHK36_020148 [Tetracentron sinense]
MESKEGDVAEIRVNPSNYSKRVVLKMILGRSDGGLGLVGERFVIGGWVKSYKDPKKEVPPGVRGSRDSSCVEILQSRIPLFRTVMRILIGSNGSIRENLGVVPPKPEKPSVAYLDVNDGSCVANLQVMVDSSVAPLIQLTPTGTSILVEGILTKASVVGKHAIELKVNEILHVGTVDHAMYPLSKRQLPLNILRGYSQLRPRTTTVASVTRIRSALTHSTHIFFQNNGCLYVHLPVITTTDCKGFSEKFRVTTLLDKANKDPNATDGTNAIGLEVIKDAIKEKSKRVEELKRTDSNKEALFVALQDLKKTNELALQLEEQEKLNRGTSFVARKVDFSTDFFSRQTYLTVSGQLHLECYACALGSVYSFGPTFRAEKSQSTKCLAEMWMVELEMAFTDLEDAINSAEDYLKFMCRWTIENCSDDMKFLSKRIDKTIVNRLQSVASSSFEKISYTDVVEVLKKVKLQCIFIGNIKFINILTTYHGFSSYPIELNNQVTKKAFEAKVEWGVPLTDEHESYLADEIYKKPVIIYNYPKEVKPFYMRLNNDGKTVAALDIVVPKGGALIRGGQREERIDTLLSRIKEFGLPREQYEWYLDLRRHGTVKHSGFSLYFDHMVLFATGLSDIRDVIPFPRSYDNVNN